METTASKSPTFILRFRNLFLAIGVSIFLTGCVSETTEGGRTTFAYQLWAPLVTIALGVGLLIISIPVFASSIRGGIVLLILGIAAAFVLGPSFLIEKVTVDDAGFSVTKGLPFANKTTEIRFDQLQSISFHTQRSGRRRRSRSTYLDCHMLDSSIQSMEVTTLMNGEALKKIKAGAQSQGVPVEE